MGATDDKSWGLKRAGPMPEDREMAACRRAAVRVHRLLRDLRLQREAWADFDATDGIEAANPDVAAFNAENGRRVFDREADVLVDVVAGIIGDELRGA